MLKTDPIEETPEFKAVINEVERELKKRFKNDPMNGGHGFCHTYWAAKKELLLEKYGIEWLTPQQMNPRVRFD